MGRLAVYLATITAFYFAVGVLLLLGADAVLVWFGAAWAEGGAFDQPWINGLLLVIGVGLFLYSWRKPKPASGPSRIARWRERAMGVQSARGLMGLALFSALLEVATMLPYLGAVALITAADMGWAGRIGALAGYCIVMILPAMVMVGLRVAAGVRIDKGLNWLNAQIDRMGGEAALWIVGVAGFFLAGFAASRLF